MPEGDTLHRVAFQITTQLAGQRVAAARARRELARAQELVDTRLTAATARGKHLLLDFDVGLSVHSHLGMTGSWHLYPRGESWRKPAARAAMALRFAARDLVCFSPKLIEIDTASQIQRRPTLRRLGPDLLANDFSLDAALARLRQHDRMALGEALMNQQLVAGIGNVYKSEILFMERLDPFEAVAAFSDQTLVGCLSTARAYLRRNLDGLRRKFRYGTMSDRLWVYRRAALPCLECGVTIGMRRQGDAARSTYFCPACQGVEA